MVEEIESDGLLAEAERALTERKPLPSAVAAQWAGYLSEAFSHERVEMSTAPSDVELRLTSYPDEERVCVPIGWAETQDISQP